MDRFPRLLSLLSLLSAGALAVGALATSACSGEGASVTQTAAGGGGRGRGGDQTVPVTVAQVVQKQMPIEIRVIGAVEAYSVVSVHAQITGQLTTVNFKEGEDVKKGDVLAKIDPVTYQAQLDQAVAKKALDEALLANTKHDLERFQKVGTLAISQQQIDTQVALIKQQEAQVKSDVASIENAQAILDYTTIVAPFGGRTGIRLVDEGNLVHANDTAGIVVITQVQPITAVFTLPQQDLPTVTKAIAEGSLTAQALSTDSQTELDVGVLKVIDNQVDQQTGTIRLKAEFPNEKRQLWPGQFVNVRLLVDTLKGVTVAPTEAVQRGPDGTYVFVVNEDKTVAMRNVKVSRQDEKYAVIADGLKAGETVVTSGFARLKDGSKVSVSDGSSAPQDAQPQHHRKSPDARKSAAAETNALAVPPATEAALVTGSTPADGTRSGKHRHHRDNGQSP